MKNTITILGLAIVCFLGCAKQEPSPATGSSSADSMKNALRACYEAINTNKLDELDKYIANDIIEHASMSTREGKLEKDWLAGIKRLIVDVKNESPDHKYIVEDIITEGDICVSRVLETKTKLEDSAGVKVSRKQHKVGSLWMRWENGKFVEIWDSRSEKL